MKKAGILTYYGVHNHGAVLQANALKKVLEKKGYEVTFLRFNRNYDMIPEENSKKYKIGLSSIPFYVKYTLQRGIPNILYNLKKNQILNQYRSENLPLGNRYSNFRGELAVIGSDEVFSMEIGINPFFFGHGVMAEKVISYAGCFGPTTIDFVEEHGLSSMIGSGLKSLSAIGVRDMNSKNIADKLSEKESVLVCDPVILYGYEDEQKIFTPKVKDYIVVYAYDKNLNDPEEVNYIREYAKKNKLKIYSVGYHHKWCDKSINATPEEVLGYIRNSKLVVTDTFHGSVMSLVCNAPMVVKLRGNQNKLGFLMQEYGVEDRVVDSFADIEKVAGRLIDYSKVNGIIKARREASLKFLHDSIGE